MFLLLVQLRGGLRSGMICLGARTLKEFWEKAEFIRISHTAWMESKPHALEK